MEYRLLGRTGLRVSAIAFGAGPVSGWMELPDEEQSRTVRRALDLGVTWFDTAAGYGDGRSEASLGKVFSRLGSSAAVHIATKVRYPATGLADIRGYTRRSVKESLARLGVPQVALLQLHNGIAGVRDAEPGALTPADVLQPGGVLDAFRELRAEGRVRFLGLTGTGHPAAMREVVGSGGFDTLQVPYNALNPSAGHDLVPPGEVSYGSIMADCAAQRMGVFAIRVLAGGALLDAPPSAHTHRTPYFPLTLYQRDRERGARLRERLGLADLRAVAVRFALSHPDVTAAIIGFRRAEEIDEVAQDLRALPAEQAEAILALARTHGRR